MNSVRELYDQNLSLWHKAREQELQTIESDTDEWWLLFHEGDMLAGWCTQIFASNTIRENELPQLRNFPTLDESGPYANWLAAIRTSKPNVAAYVANLEQIRLALLQQVGAS